ncbi:CaiB/BaiF CoA transferase family protein [Gilvimarinus sp. F26214L]|uniref:CaiB/BaiF CoA transferase family protein n=1 Tax=Gilvimarinus sp. DZF01 TaxID=3461371 RepID=UPI0040463650
MHRSAPLSGITVVDFSHVMAGPFCTHTLVTLGARVIKVERAGEGDVMRHYDTRPEFKDCAPPFIAVNAGKESIALDLKNPSAREVARKLIRNADVVVENFRPGVMARLGLGFEECQKENEKIIYCSVSGFGQRGPLRDNPAYDHVVQAMSGVMSLTGEPGSKPMKVGFPVLDTFAGYTAATAIITALLQRERQGTGEYIDVAMLDASLNLMISMVAPWLIAGDVPKKVGNRGFNMSPTSDTFRTGDGDIAIGANTQRQYEALCGALGREDLVDDLRFCTRELRIENENALREEIERTTAQRSAVEWEVLFNQVSVPSAAIRSVPDITAHPHLQERHLKIPIAGGGGEPRSHTLGPGFDLGSWARKELADAPAIGEHTSALLSALGYSSEDIRRLEADGAVQSAC